MVNQIGIDRFDHVIDLFHIAIGDIDLCAIVRMKQGLDQWLIFGEQLRNMGVFIQFILNMASKAL
ncbi:hypothetical protein EA26_05385 [Vibrio navarrensis]|uniref:Uncharacterized protein n=1 Tax=Vibrio navarrensis TaxID=29495 RepID=A0A099LTZ4_9VIBR|nr:hypothetical protein EA26_05385 [Vibrio navarrensis]